MHGEAPAAATSGHRVVGRAHECSVQGNHARQAKLLSKLLFLLSTFLRALVTYCSISHSVTGCSLVDCSSLRLKTVFFIYVCSLVRYTEAHPLFLSEDRSSEVAVDGSGTGFRWACKINKIWSGMWHGQLSGTDYWWVADE